METDRTLEVEVEKERPAVDEVVQEPALSAPETLTNATPQTAETNLQGEASPAAGTNKASAGPTNQAVASAEEPTLNTSPEAEKEVPTALAGRAGSTAQSSGKKGGVGLWAGLFVISVIALGILVAMDVSQYFGNKTLKVIYNDDGEGVANPEYEAAEQVWANGKHLEAISMMREYLNKNPREQYVAIRIAEIYEKDLGNYLAAALEYEEVLKHKLPAERWGWAAIHLCNLYFKLGQEQKGYDLLRRLVKDHPETAAAEKARKRLEHVEGTQPTEGMILEEETKTAPAPRTDGNLPPGFRKKK
jgi:tetratricopeptide (TPR) repeat protein